MKEELEKLEEQRAALGSLIKEFQAEIHTPAGKQRLTDLAQAIQEIGITIDRMKSKL